MMKRSLCFLVVLLSVTRISAQKLELETLKSALPNTTDSLRYVDVLNRLAILYYERNIDTTLYYTQKAREIAERLNYSKGKADALNNLGVFFDIKGNPQLAIRYYNEGYQLYKQIKDSVNCVQGQMNLAMVYSAIGNHSKAIKYYNEALREGEKLKQDSILSLVIYNYLLQYPSKFKGKSLTSSIAISQKIAKKYNDNRVLLALEQLIADDMIGKGKKHEGLLRLHNAVDTALSREMYYASMDMLIALGDYLYKDEPQRSMAYYLKALQVADKNNYLYYSQIVTRKLFDLYYQKGNYKEAAKYSNKLMVLTDKQHELNNNSSIDYVDYAVKEGEVKALKRHTEDQAKLLMLVIFATISITLLLFFIVRQLNKTKKLNIEFLNQNRELKAALSSLEQSHQDHAKIMKVVAHDLRHPMGAVQALANLMLLEEGRSDSDKEMLEMIKSSSNDSLEMAGELLQTHFQLEDLKKEPVELSGMLKYCVSMLQDKANKKKQRLKLNVNTVTTIANREKLWRVSSNLIANAIKFSPIGSEIVVATEKMKHTVRILVKDNGIGIPPEIGERVFDMFTDAKRSGTADEKSYGLGLAICKQIVEVHGGKIWHEANNPKGTVFFVELLIS